MVISVVKLSRYTSWPLKNFIRSRPICSYTYGMKRAPQQIFLAGQIESHRIDVSVSARLISTFQKCTLRYILPRKKAVCSICFIPESSDNLYRGSVLSQRVVPSYSQSFLSTSSIPPPKKKRVEPVKATVTWKSVVVVVVFGGALLAFMLYVKKEKDIAIAKERSRVLGKAKIGGTFDLIDHNGKPCKSEDLLGKWLLIYFGFTHCPDVCPDELEKLGAVVDNIDGSQMLPDGIQPVFITVDPVRDSTEAVKKYVHEFHPKFIGLTGSVEKIAEACRAYRVYFSAGPKDVDDDYIVDHTIIIYLVDPSGNFVDYYGQNKDVDGMTGSVMVNIKRYEAQQKKGVLGVLGL